ncbi:MAG: arginase family protein, partial [Pyrinomonadaceae bacterium]
SQPKDELQTMNDIFELTEKPDQKLIYETNKLNDSRLGGFVLTEKKDYENADICILGFQKDEKFVSDSIRQEFYRLTNFGINKKVLDLGNVKSVENYSQVIEKVLQDDKRLMIIGAGNELSYQSGFSMANVFGKDRWLAINVDSHLDSGFEDRLPDTPSFQKLLKENLIVPKYFYEIGFQPYFCSPHFFRFLQNHDVKMVSLEQLRSRETADLELRELIRQEFISHSRSMSIFFNFSMNAVRASDAPGVSASSPFGLRAGEFLTLIQFAAKLINTKVIQFSEVNPTVDIENRTSKLVAIAMHRFCSTAGNV